MPLIGLAGQESVEALEPQPERPVVERTGRRGLGRRREMPLPGAVRGVAVEPQHLGDRRCRPRQERVVAREPGRHLGDRGEADRVVVAAGEQRCPARRAQRGRVEVGVAQPARREFADVRGIDRTAERRELSEAEVVEHDHDDVRRLLPAGGRRRASRESPPGRSPRSHRGRGCERCGRTSGGWSITSPTVRHVRGGPLSRVRSTPRRAARRRVRRSGGR